MNIFDKVFQLQMFKYFAYGMEIEGEPRSLDSP